MEFTERRKVETQGNVIDDITGKWEETLSHVYAYPENAQLANKLIKLPKQKYQEDHNWEPKLKAVEDELENTDDEDEIRAILMEALGQVDDEGYDDDEDEIEPEEDEEF